MLLRFTLEMRTEHDDIYNLDRFILPDSAEIRWFLFIMYVKVLFFCIFVQLCDKDIG